MVLLSTYTQSHCNLNFIFFSTWSINSSHIFPPDYIVNEQWQLCLVWCPESWPAFGNIQFQMLLSANVSLYLHFTILILSTFHCTLYIVCDEVLFIFNIFQLYLHSPVLNADWNNYFHTHVTLSTERSSKTNNMGKTEKKQTDVDREKNSSHNLSSDLYHDDWRGQ